VTDDDACSALPVPATFFVVLVAQDILNQSLSKNCPLLHHSTYIWHSVRASVSEFNRLHVPENKFPRLCAGSIFIPHGWQLRKVCPRPTQGRSLTDSHVREPLA
jgi:hypothetical protein